MERESDITNRLNLTLSPSRTVVPLSSGNLTEELSSDLDDILSDAAEVIETRTASRTAPRRSGVRGQTSTSSSTTIPRSQVNTSQVKPVAILPRRSSSRGAARSAQLPALTTLTANKPIAATTTTSEDLLSSLQAAAASEVLVNPTATYQASERPIEVASPITTTSAVSPSRPSAIRRTTPRQSPTRPADIPIEQVEPALPTTEEVPTKAELQTVAAVDETIVSRQPTVTPFSTLSVAPEQIQRFAPVSPRLGGRLSGSPLRKTPAIATAATITSIQPVEATQPVMAIAEPSARPLDRLSPRTEAAAVPIAPVARRRGRTPRAAFNPEAIAATVTEPTVTARSPVRTSPAAAVITEPIVVPARPSPVIAAVAPIVQPSAVAARRSRRTPRKAFNPDAILATVTGAAVQPAIIPAVPAPIEPIVPPVAIPSTVAARRSRRTPRAAFNPEAAMIPITIVPTEPASERVLVPPLTIPAVAAEVPPTQPTISATVVSPKRSPIKPATVAATAVEPIAPAVVAPLSRRARRAIQPPAVAVVTPQVVPPITSPKKLEPIIAPIVPAPITTTAVTEMPIKLRIRTPAEPPAVSTPTTSRRSAQLDQSLVVGTATETQPIPSVQDPALQSIIRMPGTIPKSLVTAQDVSNVTAIKLPVASTIVPKIAQVPVEITGTTEEGLGTTELLQPHSSEQKSFKATEGIDIERLKEGNANRGKKGDKKTPYNLEELKKIAKDLDIKIKSNSNKLTVLQAIITALKGRGINVEAAMR